MNGCLSNQSTPCPPPTQTGLNRFLSNPHILHYRCVGSICLECGAGILTRKDGRGTGYAVLQAAHAHRSLVCLRHTHIIHTHTHKHTPSSIAGSLTQEPGRRGDATPRLHMHHPSICIINHQSDLVRRLGNAGTP